VIDELGHGSEIAGGAVVELLQWFLISRFVLVDLCLIPGTIVAIQRVGTVMIADAVKNASAVAEGVVSDESKLELYSTAQFEPCSRLEADAASAYVGAQPRVIPRYLIHFEDADRDSDGVPYLSSPVGRSQLNGRGTDDSKVILHSILIGVKARDFSRIRREMIAAGS
jgi:hypothetical protein